MKPKILIVEDSETIREMLQDGIGVVADCLFAERLIEASSLFVQYWGEISAILVDGSVPMGGDSSDEDLTPEEWVRRVRKIGFSGQMIAFSTDAASVRSLREAGCSAEFLKGDTPLERLFELLGLWPVKPPK